MRALLLLFGNPSFLLQLVGTASTEDDATDFGQRKWSDNATDFDSAPEQLDEHAEPKLDMPMPDTTNTSCVQCPWCVRNFHTGCARRIRKRHKDCYLDRRLCTRDVYECPNTDAMFTHPLLTEVELQAIYKSHRSARSARSQALRAIHQAEWLGRHQNASFGGTPLPPNAMVVEAGCSTGELLRRFGAADRHLVCFEPQGSNAATASLRARLSGKHQFPASVINSVFSVRAYNASDMGAKKIDLFMSSHVLEHVPDLCTFLHELFAVMAPGGAVFSELPNHDRRFVQTVRGWHGGVFHVTYPTPRSLMLMMESVGFRLGLLQTTYGGEEGVANSGMFLRALFFKPTK